MNELIGWIVWRIEFASWSATADRYLGWIEKLAQPPDSTLLQIGPDAASMRLRALKDLPSIATLADGSHTCVASILEWRSRAELRPEVAEWLGELAAEYAAARARAAETVQAFRVISDTAGALAAGIKMRFLYDERVKLFGVGYAVGGPREFNSHYDLLASECRLASLVAIARGDVPVEHWHAMARPFIRSKSGEALLSWNGTMFEYLMPSLFTRTFENSLLERACRDAVDRQIEYGRETAFPGVFRNRATALSMQTKSISTARLASPLSPWTQVRKAIWCLLRMRRRWRCRWIPPRPQPTSCASTNWG